MAALFFCDKNHYWIGDRPRPYARSRPQCPTCGEEWWRTDHLVCDTNLAVTQLRVRTFAQKLTSKVTLDFVEQFSPDSILTILKKHNYKPSSIWLDSPVVFSHQNKNLAVFDANFWKPDNKTGALVMLTKDSDDPILKELKEAITAQEKFVRAQPKNVPGPMYDSIRDSIGAELKIGDWAIVGRTGGWLSIGKIYKIKQHYKNGKLCCHLKTKEGWGVYNAQSPQLYRMTDDQIVLHLLSQ